MKLKHKFASNLGPKHDTAQHYCRNHDFNAFMRLFPDFTRSDNSTLFDAAARISDAVKDPVTMKLRSAPIMSKSICWQPR